MLVFVPTVLSVSDAKALVADMQSWDLCDQPCDNLFLQMPCYPALIDAWADAAPL